MKKRTGAFILVIILLNSFTAIAQFKVIGYIPNWTNLTTFSDNFDFSRVSHLNIAFKTPDGTGVLPAMTTSEAYLVTKAHANGVKVFLSLGGAGAPDFASTINLSTLSSKLKQYTVDNNLDGLDIDLEGSSIGSRYNTFIQVLADSLHPVGKKLSAAVPALDGASISTSTFSHFDWVNIMAYDLCGPTWGTPGEHSPYDFSEDALNYWEGRGLPQAKAILGVPFYGYEFGSTASMYAVPFKTIAAGYPSAVNDDNVATTGDNVVYYNGLSTMIDKTGLAVSSGGGIMIWDLSMDATGNNSLLKTIVDVSGYVTTGVTNSTTLTDLEIFPNPSGGLIALQGQDFQDAQVELYNAFGQKIHSYTSVSTLDLSSEAKGIYYLHINKGEKSATRKIVVQ